MGRVSIRPEAEKDLAEIWWYIAQDNPDSADKVLDEIEETSRKLVGSKKWVETGTSSSRVCKVSPSASI